MSVRVMSVNDPCASDIPIVFILGTGRCGSSLLQEVVTKHPATGFVSNVDDRLASFGLTGRRNSTLYGLVPPAWTKKGRVRFAPSEGYRVLSREVSPLLARPARDLYAADVSPWLARRLASFFERRYLAQRSTVFTHKLTGWPRADLLAQVFPRARFVHVVRDGRAVANSLLQMSWWSGYRGPEHWRLGPLDQADRDVWEAHDRSFAVLAGLYWKILIEAFERAHDRVDAQRWTTVRYEDLVESPRATMSRVLDWVGLPWTPVFERRFGKQRFGSARRTAFEHDLSASQLDALDTVLAATLRRVGYGDDERAAEPSRQGDER